MKDLPTLFTFHEEKVIKRGYKDLVPIPPFGQWADGGYTYQPSFLDRGFLACAHIRDAVELNRGGNFCSLVSIRGRAMHADDVYSAAYMRIERTCDASAAMRRLCKRVALDLGAGEGMPGVVASYLNDLDDKGGEQSEVSAYLAMNSEMQRCLNKYMSAVDNKYWKIVLSAYWACRGKPAWEMAQASSLHLGSHSEPFRLFQEEILTEMKINLSPLPQPEPPWRVASPDDYGRKIHEPKKMIIPA